MPKALLGKKSQDILNPNFYLFVPKAVLGKKLTVFSQSGLEWLYRIYREPRRMWKRYVKTNPVFVWMVAKEYIKVKLRN